MKSLLTVIACLGFLFFVTPANATSMQCPNHPYTCGTAGVCTMGYCSNEPCGVNYAPLGFNCAAGVCDGQGNCLEECDDVNGDGICDHLCVDDDNDTVCNENDQCPGEDDFLDTDGDGTPDCQDTCPLDNPDDVDGNGVCGDQIGCTLVTNTYTDSGNVAPWGQAVHTIEPVISGTPFAVSLINPDGIEWNVTYVFYDADGNFVNNTGQNVTGSPIVLPVTDLPPATASVNVYLNSRDGAIAADYTLYVDYENFDCSGCTDSDGDTVCDADDTCPGYDDLNDQDGNGRPDHCDCVDHYDIVGTTTWGGNPFLFKPDGQVSYTYSTSGSWFWYEDDTQACYNVHLDPAYYSDFPRCDFNQDGVVSLDEVYELYYFATLAGHSVGGPYAIAVCNQML